MSREGHRQALIDAVLQSLAAKGLGAASVRDVAARAGVSPGLVRHHFGSFGALLNEAYTQTLARVDAVLEAALAGAGPDPEARMAAFLEASFSPAVVDRDLLSAWLGFWGLVRTDAAAAATHAKSYSAYRERLESLLRGLGAADARACAIAMSAMLDGLWLELCLDPSTFTAEEAVAIGRKWVAGLLVTA